MPPRVSPPEGVDIRAAAAEVDPSSALVRRLLRATDPFEREEEWSGFVAEHSRLLLHVARSVVKPHDAVMDAYAHLLERLRHEDFRSLRGYTVEARSKFTTWLVVVARRMCIDFCRQRFGRSRPVMSDEKRAQERIARWQLSTLVGDSIELHDIADEPAHGPEGSIRALQLQEALDNALAALSPDHRLLLRLRFDDGHSASEIARMLGMPTPFHVYRRINAICATLKRQLQARGIDGSTP